MFDNSHLSAVAMVTLLALAVLTIAPPTPSAETETSPTKARSEETAGSPSKKDRKAERSALEKLSLKKLTLEKRPPHESVSNVSERPASDVSRKDAPGASKRAVSKKPVVEKPAPESPPQEAVSDGDPGSDKNPRRVVRAGATSVPVLPASTRKTPAKPPSTTAPSVSKPDPPDSRLLLSVPRLGLKNVQVGDSPEQAYLDREGIMHLSGTGFPHEPGSNTYIAGHAEGYNTSRIPHVFRDLHNLRQGDLIVLRDATGKTYAYRAYERLVVNPRDVWVTRPIAGKQIVSLQTCFPAPSFHKRLVVRAELVP